MISKFGPLPDMAFALDCTSAQTADGKTLNFTRSEALALKTLMQSPNRIVTRETLLDVLSGEGSDKSDRTVDFLINRLRRKLSDSARNPRYIATYYGAGYRWISKAQTLQTDLANIDFVIGPMYGLDQIGKRRSQGELLAREIVRSVKKELPSDKVVAYAPDCPPASHFTNIGPTQSIDLTFFHDDENLSCVATAKEFRTGRILSACRETLWDVDDPVVGAENKADAIVRHLFNHSWRALATSPEADGPLPVSMFNATPNQKEKDGSPTDGNRKLLRQLDDEELSNLHAWRQTDRRLHELRAADPDNAQLKIMHATHIHSKYVIAGFKLFTSGVDDRKQDEQAIENFVLEALPSVQNEPEYAIMAAKLLHFVNRGYAQLARDIAEDSHRSSVEVAKSLVIVGQLRAFAGETEAALRCIDQALNLTKPGTKSRIYVLVIRCQALLAAGRFDQLTEAKRELYAQSALHAFFFEPFFSDPNKLSLQAKGAILVMSKARATAVLKLNHYISARLFVEQEHRENMILTPLTLIVRRFGARAVPEEIAKAFPNLMARLS